MDIKKQYDYMFLLCIFLHKLTGSLKTLSRLLRRKRYGILSFVLYFHLYLCINIFVRVQNQSSSQRWSPRGRPCPPGRPRGHNLKSLTLALKAKSLTMASKPSSPRKYPVLGSRTTLFFDLLKMGQGHDQFCFVSKNARELAQKTF